MSKWQCWQFTNHHIWSSKLFARAWLCDLSQDFSSVSPYTCNVCCPMDTLRCIPYSEGRHFCSSSGHATSSLVLMRTTLSWSPLMWETLSQRAGRNGEVCFFLTSGSWCITTAASDENTFPRNRNNNKFPQGRRVSTCWFLSLFKTWSERILIFMLYNNLSGF